MANFNINTAGFVIVGLFVVTWVGALAVWRFGHIEARWDIAAVRARAEAEPSLRDDDRVMVAVAESD
jgi:high-affinity nickel-transport protein